MKNQQSVQGSSLMQNINTNHQHSSEDFNMMLGNPIPTNNTSLLQAGTSQ
jgi:hypothetical protein